MRTNMTEARVLAEASTRDGSTLMLTVVRAGFNVARSRYYTEEALREGAALFRGLKMYLDHQTRAEEQTRPEGSIRNWVASITDTAYDATERRLRATAKVIDPEFKAKLAAIQAAGQLPALGVSIRAVGEGVDTTVEGVRTFRVDRFTAGISVDFVTEAGAGGSVELLESAGGTKAVPSTAALAESFRALGLSAEEAVEAATMRTSEPAGAELVESFKHMGMSEEAAQMAARRRGDR